MVIKHMKNDKVFIVWVALETGAILEFHFLTSVEADRLESLLEQSVNVLEL